MSPQSLQEFTGRIITPPYVSNIPDVHHLLLPICADRPSAPGFLIMCSDGLVDLYPKKAKADLENHWAQVVANALRPDRGSNAALELLRDAIGGNDAHKVSRNLTVEMEERWFDDTTIIVQRL
jgi:pyruvate dehydrogenase phosphatase